ncbi:hypothetical protein PtrSN002B_011160 [Pyrenophora tritici-repentis]|uniref:Uncharacterized protein n=2 Tax=Pyrenophora tritici-repentis TaxID=45151 RepID=A0A2W1H051_9PLEO|nr:uncharacterized protein PTRG_09082 [Pyrenophora tritici-repentis Pt-1C-BFP]KAA8627668.1 hypothetical protein PtrV1_03348 [Pyrenophora tritici-repentis]EDU42133.1 predicted protein [Pyrenophora tritici-repentis Pt-1C-BFP]KAF7442301.1 hypothetical protein A1F99_131700 [Pyrenophora tritici-repentis]KAF7579326.1 hypothetical protein PtrM4_035660 [Pyrenophora tritici-repentis]KAG9378250.1 hypothetical protein A1F94_011366 [Pyrenophora tritici-repentis]
MSTSPTHAPMTVPMGFGAQLRALQDAQREQTERIEVLERENAELKEYKDQVNAILDRVQDRVHTLEQYSAYLASRRREVVSQLTNLRTLHQEADNAFQVRTADIQPDDLEGMLGSYGTMITTAMNHHQRVLGQMRMNGQFPPYTTPLQHSQYPQRMISAAPYHNQYPSAYSSYGYCYAHNMPYCCVVCGQ